MALGDVGGVVTELTITCRTEDSGTINISKGDTLKLSGQYIVTNATDDEDELFGVALAKADRNSQSIPVQVRGIAVVAYTGTAPTVDGVKGVTLSATDGTVKTPASGNGRGINLKVDTNNSTVDVLL